MLLSIRRGYSVDNPPRPKAEADYHRWTRGEYSTTTRQITDYSYSNRVIGLIFNLISKFAWFFSLFMLRVNREMNKSVIIFFHHYDVINTLYVCFGNSIILSHLWFSRRNITDLNHLFSWNIVIHTNNIGYIHLFCVYVSYLST